MYPSRLFSGNACLLQSTQMLQIKKLEMLKPNYDYLLKELHLKTWDAKPNYDYFFEEITLQVRNLEFLNWVIWICSNRFQFYTMCRSLLLTTSLLMNHISCTASLPMVNSFSMAGVVHDSKQESCSRICLTLMVIMLLSIVRL